MEDNFGKEILRNNYCEITSCIEVGSILMYLFEKRVVSLDERQRIEKVPVTDTEKAGA